VNDSAILAVNKDRREYQGLSKLRKHLSQTSFHFLAYRTHCIRVFESRIPSARPKLLWTPSAALKFVATDDGTA
jgi:hypothetical protein